ncbi:MAG: CotH kinase family protein [Chitinophagales bacterium]
MYKRTILFLLTILFSVQAICAIDHWETVVYSSDEWHYQLGVNAPSADWNMLNFNDENWSRGEGGIGYADGDDNTNIAAVPSLRMRKKFELLDLSKIEAVIFHADYDDAFVAYLNGVEIARANIEGNPPAFDADAIEAREAEMYQGGLPVPFLLPKNAIEEFLLEGENVLAVQVHNKNGINSSDMSAIFFLSLGINDTSNAYGEVPEWFKSPSFSSHLPIITLQTNGQTIEDTPSILADLGIIWNGEGNMNDALEEPKEYAGTVAVELRGSSSLFFPKNNYEFETRDEFGEDIDTSFLGFPAEEDWILHGPFSDKTLLRNVLTMHLAQEMGQYASRTQFVELVINGDYRGVYVLMEKIKRDNDRVDVAKLKETDIEGDEVTGGYIFKIDRGDQAWFSQYDKWKNPGEKLSYVLVYPDLDDIQLQQLEYIESYVDSFEMAIMSPNHQIGGKHYEEFIDLNSFTEHFIISELGKNVDAYRFSSYFHKKKDSDGGKIHAGPVWDFNLAFNNADYGGASTTSGWLYYISQAGAEPIWWNKMLQDPLFRNILRCRWEELRQGPLDLDVLFAFIDGQVELLGEAATRNFERWDILNEYVWPNPIVSGSYEGEISNLKTWIALRIGWMDANLFGFCQSVGTNDVDFEARFDIFPNPTNGSIFVQIKENHSPFTSQLYLTDVLGRKIKEFPANQNLLDISELPNGVYFVILEMDGQKYGKKVVKL